MKTLRFAALAAALLIFTGCPAPQPATPVNPVTVQGNVVTPAKTYDFVTAFATALACDPATLTWAIEELGGPGAVNGVDGWVTTAGIYHSPSCGSAYIGGVMHLQATCPSSGQTGTAVLNIGQEILNRVAVAAAITNPGLPNACYDHSGFCTPIGSIVPSARACDTVLHSSLNGCSSGEFCQLAYTIGINESAANYARIEFTCTTAMSPPLPTTLPAACP